MTDLLDHLAPEVTLDVRPVRRQEEALCRWASLRLTHHSIHPLQDSVVPEIPVVRFWPF